MAHTIGIDGLHRQLSLVTCIFVRLSTLEDLLAELSRIDRQRLCTMYMIISVRM